MENRVVLLEETDKALPKEGRPESNNTLNSFNPRQFSRGLSKRKHCMGSEAYLITQPRGPPYEPKNKSGRGFPFAERSPRPGFTQQVASPQF